MKNDVTLHFFCGKMAAGKSTLARDLALKHNAVLLCEDHWLEQLYSKEITDISSYIKYASRLQGILSDHITQLLSNGLSVVLDFPGNTLKQRSWFRSIIDTTSVSHVLHFVDVSDEVCKLQLEQRSKGKPKGTAFTTEAEFEAITQYFQAPEDTEGFNIVSYRSEHR